MHLIVILAMYLLCSSPPLSPVDPVATVDYTTAEYDYVVDAWPLATELPGKQCPFTSPPYRLSVYIYLLH